MFHLSVAINMSQMLRCGMRNNGGLHWSSFSHETVTHRRDVNTAHAKAEGLRFIIGQTQRKTDQSFYFPQETAVWKPEMYKVKEPLLEELLGVPGSLGPVF